MVALHSLLRWLVLLGAVGALIGYGRALARSRLDDVATRLGSIYAMALGVQTVLAIPSGSWQL